LRLLLTTERGKHQPQRAEETEYQTLPAIHDGLPHRPHSMCTWDIGRLFESHGM